MKNILYAQQLYTMLKQMRYVKQPVYFFKVSVSLKYWYRFVDTGIALYCFMLKGIQPYFIVFSESRKYGTWAIG